LVKAEIAGAPPVQTWRKHHGLTRDDLTRTAGLDPATVAAVETATDSLDATTLSALAQALAVAAERLRPEAGSSHA
jgi:transcriptional regulator with XRE-family HTH domain